jgi:hypothetical protein
MNLLGGVRALHQLMNFVFGELQEDRGLNFLLNKSLVIGAHAYLVEVGFYAG